MLNEIKNLPAPLKVLGALAAGAGVGAAVMTMADPGNPFWIILLVGIIIVAVLVALYVVFVRLRNKSKSGPFAALIAKTGMGRGGAVDPAQKARMDDLRKKFEEGVTTFKSAGKDLYSLPWYLVVGPSGSGKTEAIRRSNIGFPPGLQDALQGSGGTLNMHWWFTNNSVILDTAGRMFMEESAESESTEWKEFLKLLRQARGNAPINGLILAISSESLLKDSSEKIEQTAGAIARQLDVVQRLLDVRFPVFVVVTKCDKIVGFREFFETLNDPTLQHQQLGWSNPAPLDEAFRPESVEKHLEGVRQRLLRRRMGLLQNPIHTTDPTARRTDQIDEMFELPDNLVRIAPRLKRYLELIFVAGEWSPKPLFLRGIYFTSSMREGQALDMALSEALGVDVDAIPGDKQWEKDKAYFLRDMFINKVFKEKGLVTRATNVSKQITKQRRLLIGTAMATVLIVAGVAALGYVQFAKSLGPPSGFWNAARIAALGDREEGLDPMPLAIVTSDGKKLEYHGSDTLEFPSGIPSNVNTTAEFLEATGTQAGEAVKPPAIAVPIASFLGFSDGFTDKQTQAHRALVEKSVLIPLLSEARSRLQTESKWSPEAVGALAQLVRLQTYALKSEPKASTQLVGTEGKKGSRKSQPKAVPIDADVLFKYVLGEAASDKKGYAADRDRLLNAVALAYPAGWSPQNLPASALGGAEEYSIGVVNIAVNNLSDHLLALGATEGSDMKNLQNLMAALTEFRAADRDLQGSRWMRVGTPGAPSGAPEEPDQWAAFDTEVRALLGLLATARGKIDPLAESLGDQANDLPKFAAKAGESLRKEAASYFEALEAQLPVASAEDDKEAKKESSEPAAIAELRDRLALRSKEVDREVERKLTELTASVRELSPLMMAGRVDRNDARSYVARAEAYKVASDELGGALPPATPGPVPASLGTETAKMDAAIGRSLAMIEAWRGWSGTAGVEPPASATERDGALRAARRITEIVQSRRLYDLAERSLAAWPEDAAKMRQRVREVAGARIAEQATDVAGNPFRKWNRPAVPMTALEAGGEFEADWHPQAAREVVGDWAMLRDLVEPSSTGNTRAVVGRNALRAGRAYRLASESTRAYVGDYVKYWTSQATDAPRVSALDWAELAPRLARVDDLDIKFALTQLQKQVNEAMAAMPASTMWNEALEQSKGRVARAFGAMDNEEFHDRAKKVLGAWKVLASPTGGGPGEARRALLSAWTAGEARNRYFAVYRAESQPGVKYWNDLLRDSLEKLVLATQRDLIAAREALVKDAKGSPLVLGPNDMADLSPEAVRLARQAAERLEGSVGQAVTPSGEDLPEDLRSLMLRLSGSELLAGVGMQNWMRDIRGVLAVLGADRPTGLAISAYMGSDRPARLSPGVVDARERYKYAGVVVGGVMRGRAFSLSIPRSDAELKDLRVEVPAPANQATEIYLWVEDPGVTGRVTQPDTKIVLPGSWSVLREMCVARGEAARDTSGAWRVLTVTADNANYLWLSVRIDPEIKSEWPRWEQWPTP